MTNRPLPMHTVLLDKKTIIENLFLQGVDTAVKPGEYGGNITTNILEVEVKPEHHASVFICEAINEELQESVHNARTLSVKCKLFRNQVT